jgi:hypothetical protein
MGEADLLTTPEVAAIVCRPEETLRYWRWRGEELPSFKIGRSVIYGRDDLLKWVQRLMPAASELGGGRARTGTKSTRWSRRTRRRSACSLKFHPPLNPAPLARHGGGAPHRGAGIGEHRPLRR